LSDIIHEIFADNIADFIKEYNPDSNVRKVLNHIVSCRTPSLGAAVYTCECGEQTYVYHSCRDRHCPVCQKLNNARWTEKQLASALPVKYFHIVFTLPDTINDFIFSHQKEAYNALFKSASKALLILCADKKYLGATPGITAVLHTWGQTMLFHPHLHVIITAGGLLENGIRFVNKSDSKFLMPVRVLSRLFRGIFLNLLNQSSPLPYNLKQTLYQTEFFCYLKEPYDSSVNVVKYLARYANNVCISGKRIVSIDKALKTVTFFYKDNKNGGVYKELALPVLEFMRRFLLHVLPHQFMKIRHYGILNNFNKFGRLLLCRRLLNRSSPPIKKYHAVNMVCSKCGALFSSVCHLSALQLRLKLQLQC